MSERALPDLVGRTRLDNSQLRRGAREAKSEIAGIGDAGKKSGNLLESSFSSSSKAITGRLGAMGDQAQKVLDNIGSQAFKSGNLLQTAIGGGALAGAVGIAALAAKGIGEFTKLADSVRGLQRVTGATAEDASKLAAALRATGTDTAVAEKGFFLLSKTIENTPGKLAAVGVEISRQKDGSVDLFSTLGNIAEAYQKVGKGQEGNAIAAAAFGKAGAQMLPILGKTREELEAIGKTAGMRGLILDQRQVDQALKYKLALRDLGEAVKGLEINLGEGLVGGLTDVANALGDLVDLANKVAGPLGGLGTLIGASFHAVTGPITGLSDLIHGRFVKGLVESVPLVGGFAQSIFHIGEKHKEAADAADGHALSEEEVTKALEDAGKKADEEAQALDRLLNAQISLVDASLGLQGSQDALARAQQTLAEKQTAVNEAMKSNDPAALAAAQRDLTESSHGLEDAASRVAHNVADQKEQQALANGQTFDASQKTAAYKQALIDVANQIGGPTGAALLTLAGQIKDLPASTELVVTANTGQASTALALLIAQARQFQRETHFEPYIAPTPGRMAGGPVLPGQPYVVGEERAELFVPNVPGVILPRVPTGWDGAAAAPVRAKGQSSGSGNGGLSEAALTRAMVRAMEQVSVNMDSRRVGQVSRSQRRAMT